MAIRPYTPEELIGMYGQLFNARAVVDLMDAMYVVEAERPGILTEARDAMSLGQLASKMWLITLLEHSDIIDRQRITICGGWLGTLSRMILTSGYGNNLTSLDIEPYCTKVASIFNKRFEDVGRFRAVTGDMYDFKYSAYDDVIINTSAEHIPSIPDWLAKLPEGCTVIIQSNNAFDVDGHINCVNSAQELVEKTQSTDILYAGELVFPMYTRYMVALET